MDFSSLAYPHRFSIGGKIYEGQRDTKEGTVRIPYSIEPQLSIGDVIQQKTGSSFIELKIIDLEFVEGGSLRVGTKHPNMLTLTTENLTAAAHKAPLQSSISIGSISGQQVQVGNHNSQITNISLAEVVRQVSEKTDPSAKGLLRQLLENPTVSSIVGASASVALSALLS